MSVRPHPTKGGGWWVIDTGRGTSRQRTVYQGTFAAASQTEIIIKESLRKTEDIPISDTRIKNLTLPFLAWYESEVAETTMRDINNTIDMYIVPYFGNYTPDMLTVTMFNNFKSALLKKGLKHTTINKQINYFSSLLKWAIANNKCSPLPFALPRFPKKLTTSPPKKPLSRRQLNAIYKHIQPHFRLLFLLMSDQGLRSKEAKTLKVDNIDEEYKSIGIIGKGNKFRRVPFLSDRFEDELDKVLDDRLEGYLVINPKTKRPYVTIQKELNRAVKAAKLTMHVNHHLLRHTCATLLAESGMNPHALQRILGHASIETTNKIYTNVSRDFVGDEAQKIRERLRN